MARPTKLTPEIEKRILLALTAGNYLKVAAAMAGVGEATLHRWLADDRPPYRAFRTAVRQAMAEAEVRMVGTASKNPAAALRLLGAHYPQRWGRARADLVDPPPDELPAEAPALGELQAPPTLQQRVLQLPPEWLMPIMKLITAAARGHSPEWFFAPDRLAGLRTIENRDPWWKLPGEPLHPAPADAAAVTETAPADAAAETPEESESEP